jgi:hypothetical protein
MFGFLINYNKKLDFYANLKKDNFQYIDFYKTIFKDVTFLPINDFNHTNYDVIIDHTDDDIFNFNIPSDKLVIIEHEYFNRCKNINKKRILSVNKFNYDKIPVIIPVARYIDKKGKQEVLNREDNINIIIFNNTHKKAFFHINDFHEKINNILLNTSKIYKINIYYRPSSANNNLISKLSQNNKINLVDINNSCTIDLMNIYKKCHYSIIGNEQIKHSGSISNSLSWGCQILTSSLRSRSINSTSMICVENIEILEKNINYDKIYEDIENNILKNNTLLNDCIFKYNDDLF